MKAALWGAAALAVAVIAGALAVFGGSQLTAHSQHGVHPAAATAPPAPAPTVTVTAPAAPWQPRTGGTDGTIDCVAVSDNGLTNLMPLNAGGSEKAVAAGVGTEETCSVSLFDPVTQGVPEADGEVGMKLTDSDGNVSQWLVSPAQ